MNDFLFLLGTTAPLVFVFFLIFKNELKQDKMEERLTHIEKILDSIEETEDK